MKLVFDEKDKKYAEKVKSDLNNGIDVPLLIPLDNKTDFWMHFRTKEDMGINANAFLIQMISHSYVKEEFEKFGVELLEIQYSKPDTSKQAELKKSINTLIQQLNDLVASM